MKPLAAFLCSLVLLATAAHAENFLVHNGSLMALRAFPGGRIEIRYVEPRPGLWDVGVRPGTILLRGQWVGPVLNAEARVFSAFCGPLPYPVRGGEQGAVLVLNGVAPIVDPYSCVLIGGAITDNSTLIFTPAQ
jgi:hypothetical protein